ncbi:MAG TPA: alpha/beta hydrolase [Acetobacteraceae bacterium]|jgi:acetyl esterase|nr:alpha/beta hydrolase [Acetobacteraceae bacterium]
MIEDQSQIEDRRTERTVAVEPAMRDFLDAVSASGNPPIYAVTPNATRNVRSRTSARAIALPTTDIEERMIPVGPLGSTRILVVRPLAVRVRLPVVMYFHGADWILGALDTHRRLVRDIAYGARTVVVLVDYHRSLEGHYPIAFEEAYEVTKYVAENVDELNIDPTRLAIAGDGVGGNMVGAVSLFAKERDGPSICLQLLFYAVTDGEGVECPHNEFAHGPWLTRYIMKWYWPLQASLEQLDDQLPVLIITDEHDMLLDEVEAAPHKITLAGVTVTAVRSLGDVRDSIMLGGLSDTPATRGAIALANAMLRQELGK